MSDTVYMLWLEQGNNDSKLFIGVYSSELEAKAAIDRIKGEKGFAEFPEGFHVYQYKLNEDHWQQGFIVID